MKRNEAQFKTETRIELRIYHRYIDQILCRKRVSERASERASDCERKSERERENKRIEWCGIRMEHITKIRTAHTHCSPYSESKDSLGYRERESVALLRSIYVYCRPLSTRHEIVRSPWLYSLEMRLSAFSVPQRTTKYEMKKKRVEKKDNKISTPIHWTATISMWNHNWTLSLSEFQVSEFRMDENNAERSSLLLPLLSFCSLFNLIRSYLHCRTIFI